MEIDTDESQECMVADLSNLQKSVPCLKTRGLHIMERRLEPGLRGETVNGTPEFRFRNELPV